MIARPAITNADAAFNIISIVSTLLIAVYPPLYIIFISAAVLIAPACARVNVNAIYIRIIYLYTRASCDGSIEKNRAAERTAPCLSLYILFLKLINPAEDFTHPYKNHCRPCSLTLLIKFLLYVISQNSNLSISYQYHLFS